MLTDRNQSNQYYALSNFIAAVGGGLIMGKGVAAIDEPILQGSSLLAFFVGTVFGLIFLQLTSEKISRIFARCFSISGGITSFILLGIFLSYATNEKLTGYPAILFFILLSLRFGFWFYSRVLRAAAVAGQEQRIAWVEFGYYSGIITGLIFWIFLKINIGMIVALLIDALLQFSAGILDLFSKPLQPSSRISNSIGIENQLIEQSLHDKKHQKVWLWRLATAVAFLTVGVQVIIFNLAHRVSSEVSAYILAIFYLGAAISAYLCKRLKVRLEWNLTSRKKGQAIIYFGNTNKPKLNFLLAATVAALGITFIMVDILYWPMNNNLPYCLLIFVFITTFIYGTLELAILDRIGLEEKNSPHRGMILRTYSIMSLGAAISFWMLGMTKSSLMGLSVTLSLCFLFTILAINKLFNLKLIVLSMLAGQFYGDRIRLW